MTNLLSTAEAADLAGVSPSRLRALVSDGRGPTPVARGVYDRAAVEAWIAGRPGQGARTDLQQPS